MFIELIRAVLLVAMMLILARVVVSWVYQRPDVEWVVRLYEVTDYVLRPIRNVIPPFGGIDASPFIALIVISVLLRVFS